MRTKRRRGDDDAVLMEAIYDISNGHDDWLRGVSRAVVRDLQSPFGALTVTHRRRHDGSYQLEPLFVDTPDEVRDGFALATAPIENPESAIFATMLSEQFAGLRESFSPQHPYRKTCTAMLRRFGARDTNLLMASDTAADVISISPFFAHDATPTRYLRTKYRRIAAHLASAIRLRRHLEVNRTATPDAIFDGRGRALDARGDAADYSALRELRDAVRARESAAERIRTTGGAEALGLWTALVSGRWSLLDRFESDGRRFIVAIANQNIPQDPRALTPREEQAAQLAGCGLPNGRIAYAMGTTAECVSSHLHAALRKLGCRTRRDLIRMMNPRNYEFTLDLHGGIIGVIAEARATTQPESLTPAERRVLKSIRLGKSNAEIAADSGTSARTVANQVASVLRKTGANSRYEIMSNG